MTDSEIPLSIREEFISIALVAKSLIPKFVDGKDAILEMKNGGSKNWRQTEWIGWWFEFFIETEVRPTIGHTIGPSYGKTTFDLQIDHVWDLKAHPNHLDALILNDQVATRQCITDHNGVGFVIVEGTTQYDDDLGTFKEWHDKLKGKKSAYVLNRIARKAKPRLRKISFSPTAIVGIWIDSQETLEKGSKDGWISDFQKNMRNSNGKPRNAKYKFDTSKIPEKNVVGRETL